VSTQEQVALVTGASRGIGRVTALALAEAGFRVAVGARTATAAEQRRVPGSLEATADEIAALGGEALPVRMDVTDRASLAAAVGAVLDRWGRVDVLVNNAYYATGDSQLPVLDVSVEHFEKQLAGNLVAPVALAKLLLPQMLERGGGAVVNMVSGTGIHVPNAKPDKRASNLGYAASKVGLIEVAGVIANELGGRGIRSFSVQPGGVLTELVRANIDAGLMDADPDDGHWTPAEHTARTIVWLVTAPEAVELNGALINAPTFVHEKHLLGT
jgi:NAD(P)-dependent dehydrogenase (short-subunit alcohol dehydrogenase family)